MAENRNALVDSGVALAAVTAFLYCVSAAYYGGYLGIFRLDSDVLDRNFHQTLYNGFVISFPLAFGLAFAYLGYRIVYSHLLLPALTDWLRTSSKKKRRFIKLRQKLLGKRKDAAIVQREKRHSVAIAFYAAAFLTFLLSLAHFESEGQKAALERLEKINKTGLLSELMLVRINGQDIKLLALACGSRNCAGIDPLTRTINYFPQNGHSYALPPQKIAPAAAQNKGKP